MARLQHLQQQQHNQQALVMTPPSPPPPTASSSSDDLDLGLLWRELAGMRLDEVFALSRLDLFVDSKTSSVDVRVVLVNQAMVPVGRRCASTLLFNKHDVMRERNLMTHRFKELLPNLSTQLVYVSASLLQPLTIPHLTHWSTVTN
ncbi:hypothetical protein CBL_07295 [Carabus blaptoides fortunei]